MNRGRVSGVFGFIKKGEGAREWRVYSKTTQAIRPCVLSLCLQHQISFMDLTTGLREGRVNALQLRPPLHRLRPPSLSFPLARTPLFQQRQNLIRGVDIKEARTDEPVFYTADCFYCIVCHNSSTGCGSF